MRMMTSATALAALLLATAAEPASAQTWYKPAPASGVATGNLTFHTTLASYNCAVTAPWSIASGVPRLNSITLDSGCYMISVASSPLLMFAIPSPGPGHNAQFWLFWNAPLTSNCMNTPTAFFDNATSSITFNGSAICTFSGTLTFPGLQLLP